MGVPATSTTWPRTRLLENVHARKIRARDRRKDALRLKPKVVPGSTTIHATTITPRSVYPIATAARMPRLDCGLAGAAGSRVVTRLLTSAVSISDSPSPT